MLSAKYLLSKYACTLGLGLLLAVQSIAAFPQAAVIIEAELPDFVAVEAAGQDEARQVGKSGILSDKTMDDKLMCIANNYN